MINMLTSTCHGRTVLTFPLRRLVMAVYLVPVKTKNPGATPPDIVVDPLKRIGFFCYKSESFEVRLRLSLQEG